MDSVLQMAMILVPSRKRGHYTSTINSSSLPQKRFKVNPVQGIFVSVCQFYGCFLFVQPPLKRLTQPHTCSELIFTLRHSFRKQTPIQRLLLGPLSIIIDMPQTPFPFTVILPSDCTYHGTHISSFIIEILVRNNKAACID